MPRKGVPGLFLFLTPLLVGGCLDLDLPDEISLLPRDTSFVIRGTAALVDRDGPCLVWVGENGITYLLFQSPLVDNATFDQVVTPDVTSRLQIAPRDDLETACAFGAIVEVRDVLEIVE